MPTIKIGDYLLKRLKEINIETIFGVPGDYNMVSTLSLKNIKRKKAEIHVLKSNNIINSLFWILLRMIKS